MNIPAKEIGNVLDHWEQLPNDLRLDPGFGAINNALAALHHAVTLGHRMPYEGSITEDYYTTPKNPAAVLSFEQVKGALQSFGDGEGNYVIRTDYRVQELTDFLNRLARPAAVALGKLGGASKSAAKKKASRKNGKLGGRPKKAK